METYEGYCTKCRKKVTVTNGKKETLKNGKPALRGTCPTCGTGVLRFLPADK